MNEICEKTEEILNSFENSEPKTAYEKREHAKLINELKNEFQGLMAKAEKKLDAGTQNKMVFDDLQGDINRKTAEHAKILQQKMVIVGEMMKDVSETIKNQGEALDRIDVQVEVGKENTSKGVVELEKTDLSQRRKKSCYWGILLVALGFLVAIVIVLAMTLK